MNPRISVVNNTKIQNVVDSATANFGDSIVLAPNARIFAIQRENPIFFENEGDNIDIYPTFSREIPKSLISEHINIRTINKTPFIKVDGLYILSFTASAIFHVGSTQVINNEARVKIFRNLSNE